MTKEVMCMDFSHNPHLNPYDGRNGGGVKGIFTVNFLHRQKFNTMSEYTQTLSYVDGLQPTQHAIYLVS